jgi:hypothetical protein
MNLVDLEMIETFNSMPLEHFHLFGEAIDYARNALFSAAHRRGYWLTNAYKLLKPRDIEPKHLQNILYGLKARAQKEATNIVAYYISAPEPNGEMAQEAYQMEAQQAFNRQDTLWEEVILQHPLYSRLYWAAYDKGGVALHHYPKPEREADYEHIDNLADWRSLLPENYQPSDEGDK